MAIFGIQDACNLTLRQKSDNKIALYADYANVSSLEWKSESSYATSKGVKAIRWDKNREGNFRTEMEVFDIKWIAMLAGSSFVTGATEVLKREVLTASAANKVTITGTPKTGSLSVFTLDSDGVSLKKEQTLGTPASTVDTYSIVGSEITLNATTAPEGTEIVVYYLVDSEATAQKLSIKYNQFPGNFEITADGMIRNKETGVDQFVQIVIPNCKPKSDFTITMDVNSPTKISADFDLFPDANGDMATYTIL